MSEPVGWNVYYGGRLGMRFMKFISNGEVLDREAAKLAGDAEAYVATQALCGAVLFAPGLPPLWHLPAWTVFTYQADMPGVPVHGPAPLTCAREPHPEGTWHHDGRSTWFRS